MNGSPNKFNEIRNQLPPISYLKHLYLDYWLEETKMNLNQLREHLEEGTLPDELINTINKVFEGPSEEQEIDILCEYKMSLEPLESINFKADITKVKLNDVISKESKIYNWGKYYIRKLTISYCVFDFD